MKLREKSDNLKIVEVKDDETGELLYSYWSSDDPITYNKTPILSASDAYELMLKFVSTYFKDNMVENVGEVITRMHFDSASDTEYTECWELWERIVLERLKEKKEKL